MALSGKNALVATAIIIGICGMTVGLQNVIFEISKRTQQFTPPALPEGGTFKYTDLIGEIELSQTPGGTTIEGTVLLVNDKRYSFIRAGEDVSHKCRAYLLFEYDENFNVIKATTTPVGVSKYTRESLIDCFNASITFISSVQENAIEVASGNSWKPSKIDNFFD